MSTRKIKFLRITAAFLLICFVNEICFPTVSFALTSVDTQPEVWGYQPVDATDNVNISTGNFNYTIPITSIPEFPMAIGYNGGLGMDQEASTFGFGFNGFSGAITREVNGLPDDVNGATKAYHFGNENMIDVSTTITYGNSTTIFGFNNYSGGYGAVGEGLSASGMIKFEKYGLSLGLKGTVGINVMNDSRLPAARLGYSGTLTLQVNGIGIPLASAYGTKDLVGGGSTWQKRSNVLGNKKTNIETAVSGRTNTAAVLPLANVFPNRGGSSLSQGYGYAGFRWATSWGKYKLTEKDINKTGYGYMYLCNHDRTNPDVLADMSVEGEDSYNDGAYNNPSYLRKDYYSVNTMGMAGAMELYQNSYGVVSRNSHTQQLNERRIWKVKTKIDEIHPWTAVNQLSQNKSTDIIALVNDLKSLMKNSETKDITNNAYQFFSEKEVTSLNKDIHRFKNPAEFRMRGDQAGEFDMASDDYKDHEADAFSMIHVTGTGNNTKFALLGREKDVPLYYPAPRRNYNQYSDQHPMERGTKINRHTIGQMLSNSSLNSVDPNNASTNILSPYDPFNVSQSFYTNYVYNAPAAGRNENIKLNEYLGKENIMSHIANLRSEKPGSYFDDLIGGLDVQSENGLKYYFNLPVFNKSYKTLELSGRGKLPPIGSAGENDYHSYNRDNHNYERGKSEVEDEYYYPYAWLLTAIVGQDYIDFDNIPGPSDGDIGYWVKFRYVRASDNYRWRVPFTGMDHIPGIHHQYDDDIYTVSSGTKEIYYLAEVESSQYLTKYQYQKRFDGIDAASFWNGDAYNCMQSKEQSPTIDRLGNNYQFAVTQIDLYKKHTQGNNSAAINESDAKIIKSSRFFYDYSTSSAVPNNYRNYGGVLKSTIPYHIDYSPSIASSDCTPPATSTNIGSGKLTLRKVQHIAYSESGNIADATYLPSYTFNYYGDCKPEHNPAYDIHQVDQWGNYSKNAKAHNANNVDYYHRYTEYVKKEADENAKAFKLKSIQLPSGGSMEINYEANSYGYVQDQNPFAMRRILRVDDGSADNSNTTGDISYVTVDVTDLEGLGLEQAKIKSGLNEEHPILSPQDIVYGEVAYYRNMKTKDPRSLIVVNEEAKVISFDAPIKNGDTWSQRLTFQTQANEQYKGRPFIEQCQNYMYEESIEARAVNDEVNSSGDGNTTVQVFLDRYESLYRDDPKDAIRKLIAHGNHMLRSRTERHNRFNTVFDPPGQPDGFLKHLSFLRTRTTAKYTGAAVSSLVLRDGFNYATSGTLQGSSPVSKNNEYGTNYFYDLNGDGTGTSSGVATTEPGGGKSCVVDVMATTGSGFMPAPFILHAKTTIENKYQEEENEDTQNGDKISRKKGKTVYEFYTPKDQGLQFASNFKQAQTWNNSTPYRGNFFLFGILTFFTIKIKIFKKVLTIKRPKILKLILNWSIQDRYHTKSYAYTDYTDIYGKVKSVHQLDAFGQELGTQAYNYYGLDEAVPVYKDNFNATSSVKKPGKVDQIWSEAYYAKQDDIKVITAYIEAKCRKDFNYTTMEYSYIPPVLKEVVSTMDGLTTTSSYTGFDYYTGNTVEAKTNDSYKNQKIYRTVPAYWKYPKMGPSSVNDENLNMLGVTAGSYTYLNTVDNNHLLSANIVTWTQGNSNTWAMIPYLQPIILKGSGNTSNYYYYYNVVPGSTITAAYNPSSKSSDKFIKRNAAIFNSYEGYIYEVPLKTDNSGTFASFVDFDYNQQYGNVKWKKLSTNELFAQGGELIQSKDLLSKYSSQLLGYNSMNTVGTVSNSTWAGSAYEGAENTYANLATGRLMLEDDKVKLVNAKVVKACPRIFLNRTLDHSTLSNAHILTVKLPASVDHNIPFAKLNITYSHNTAISRSFFVSLNDNNDFEIISNQGETFAGFFVLKQLNGSYKLVFNPSDFSAISLDNTVSLPNYTVSFAANQPKQDCPVNTKPYVIPDNDCTSKAHTGNYAFSLDAGKKGTEFILSASTIPVNELKRQYKAMVWVHNLSPIKTELLIQVTNNAGVVQQEFKTTKQTPYVIAGDWSLLRVEADLSTIPNMENLTARVFVRNPTSAGVVIYDDYRVLPYHAEMQNFVFDHKYNRSLSGLDANNYANYSEYDNRGRVVASSIELQNDGKVLIQKYLYNDQKKN